MILDPRGHFKTTLDIADCVQWILNFPDVRILIMSGARELVERMVKEAKYHFQGNLKMRALFPEFCAPLAKEFGTMQEFTTPARKNMKLREPTLTLSTADSTKAGSHYDIIKCDDLVNETNVGTKEQLEKTITAFNYTIPLLEPFGYQDVIGTRYDYSDLYGWIIDHDDGTWKKHSRTVWFEDEQGDKTLLFPERFTIEMLEKFQKDDPYLFNCQYLNNPIPYGDAHFTEENIMRHTIPPSQIPKGGLRGFCAWDLGFSQKEYADFSVGVVGLFDDRGNIHIVDMERGRFSPHELVVRIFHLFLRWRRFITRVGIESASGSKLLEPGLHAFAIRNRLRLPLDWITVNPNVKKRERIASLHTLLKEDKLWFSSGLPQYKAMVQEFIRFPRFKNDDIPDAISRLLHYRGAVDMQFVMEDPEMISAPVYPGAEILGAGIVA